MAIVFALLALIAGLGCRARQPEPPGSLAGLSPGWNRIAGVRGTGCAHDSSYAFFVKPGRADRLTIYFQAGGGCWNSRTCDLSGPATFFDPDVDSTDAPGRFVGILDLSDPRNPVHDHSVVFVPYCTADVFLGSATVTYVTSATPTRSFQIQHWGRVDAERVLDWVFTHFRDPDLIFVTGSSAGAIPSPLYASRLAQHYPQARVVQLGDAAGGYRTSAIAGLLAVWGATSALRRDDAYRGIDSATLNFETLYIVSARATPQVTFAQYNAAQDADQLAYLSLLGVHGVPLERLLAANFADIRRANPRFRTYTSPGEQHAILLRPEFYTLAVDGVVFRDWVAGLLAGTATPDVGQPLLVNRTP